MTNNWTDTIVVDVSFVAIFKIWKKNNLYLTIRITTYTTFNYQNNVHTTLALPKPV